MAPPQITHSGPVRVALLPLNIPAGGTNVQWMAMAGPVHAARTMRRSPDLEIIPLWQSMAALKEAQADSKEIAPMLAAEIASRLGAKWIAAGELRLEQGSAQLHLEFIPANTDLIPYHYQREIQPESFPAAYQEAISQFLRYLVLPQFARPEVKFPANFDWKTMCETLGREYGWLQPVEPGKGDSFANYLAMTDLNLARLLFNPEVYAGLGPPAPRTRPAEARPPTGALTTKKELADRSPSPSSQAAEAPSVQNAAQSEKQAGNAPDRLKAESANAIPFVPMPVPRSSRQSGVGSFQPVIKNPPNTPQLASAEERAAPDPEPVVTDAAILPREQTKEAPAAQPVKKIVSKGAAKPATPPPAKKPDPKSSSEESPGYQLQVFSFPNPEDAEAKAQTLRKSGYKIEIVTSDLGEKGTWHRVRLVGFGSRLEAKKAGEKLKAAKAISQYWIVR
jgi:cell division protein FtsN